MLRTQEMRQATKPPKAPERNIPVVFRNSREITTRRPLCTPPAAEHGSKINLSGFLAISGKEFVSFRKVL
jgi:hypothetical protein